MLQKGFIKQCNYAEITLGRLNPLMPIALHCLCCERVSGLGSSAGQVSFSVCQSGGW